MQKYSGNQIVNIGWGKDISIKELAYLIREVVGYEGTLIFDHSRPDGTSRKLLDVSRLTKLGFTPRIPLQEGITKTYADFVKKYTA
jgi:GDP-L-fucose synthase